MDFAPIQENLLQEVLGRQSDCMPINAKPFEMLRWIAKLGRNPTG